MGTDSISVPGRGWGGRSAGTPVAFDGVSGLGQGVHGVGWMGVVGHRALGASAVCQMPLGGGLAAAAVAASD